MKLSFNRTSRNRRGTVGITLVEVVLSLAIAGISIGAIVAGYVYSAKVAEWSAYSLAANSLAMQKIEQCRAAKFDVLTTPITDELTVANFPTDPNLILDVPRSGDNIAYATNYTTITTISSDPPLKMIRVDCVWPFKGKSVHTNTIVTYRAADQ